MKRLLLLAISLFVGFTSFTQTNSITSYYSWALEWCEGTYGGDSVDLVIAGTYNPGNVYTIQLSDGSGSFASPTVIYTQYGTNTGGYIIGVNWTNTIPPGTGYRIRGVASDPVTIGPDNGYDITIHALPTVSLAPFSDLCGLDAPITLTEGSPAGGTYSGTWVTGGSFNPMLAGAGSYNINYTYTDMNGCTNSTDAPIAVNIPTVTQAPFVDLCMNNGALTLTGGSPTSGIYSGTGVTGNDFDPMAAGIGSHDITYTYTDGNGCSNSTIESVVVKDIPTVSLGTFSNICVNDAQFPLTGGLPTGGTYLGTGVTSYGDFAPVLVGIGTHTIIYSITGGNGCSNTATESIIVDGCAGLSEKDAANVLLSPNPAETSFSIASDLVIDQIIVTDINGRTVKVFGNQQSYTIAELTEGMYIVNIIAGEINLVKRLMVR
jgi:hypothetical protein